MSKYLQKKFALSEQGGRDLTKAIFSCALTNMGLIFPMGILFLFMERLLGPLVGIQAPSLGMAGYVAACIVLLVIIFISGESSMTPPLWHPIRKAPICVFVWRRGSEPCPCLFLENGIWRI